MGFRRLVVLDTVVLWSSCHPCGCFQTVSSSSDSVASQSHVASSYFLMSFRLAQCVPLPQGFALAKRLHDDAVQRGAMTPLQPSLAVPAAFQAAGSSIPVSAL